MKHLSFLRRHANMVVATCLSLSLFSCNNEDEFTPSNGSTNSSLTISMITL